MTANKAGMLATMGFWRTLRRLRDQWVLLVFLATALFWMRDVYEQFTDLPVHVAELDTKIEELRRDITQLDTRLARAAPDRKPALVFPGTGHSIGDGRPGTFVTVRLQPAKRVRQDCRTMGLVAFMIDAQGRWFSVETDLLNPPQISGEQDLAFDVRVHPRMAVGRAQFLMQATQDCVSHLQIDTSPRLHFRVLPDLPRHPESN
ncbi:MAG: hypothetical protein AAF557_17635 [Pseudomonadota bacterium]